ncbi:hypothetical protein CROQUDRAFT_109076 [Cronartium quercuum f. sp. fusiforme G11]|uniref:DNA repair protein RAD50 n=1 Tax=Cronartium quercuum f. sp. fusiforme G11 TaxID=708437 RepID=A0A9P6TAG9_9BASI|nr:hypothetical protein CROQUDRAFT_109076 [Cronartium quercuum f. sp. fusiforme G11]
MSTIDKIAIRGIRSFDHEKMAVMQFYSPLTVIVGHNGSGKTTIIECLKYITTGDLPPNTKGGAFVLDPSMAGESTVMAEVMLRFKNAAGTKLVASRRLQVSKKKNAGLTMKTLEGTLSYNDDGREGAGGKRRTISTKCAEMDIELPRQLGISKAILENVIFCHQEESNWPLSEPAGLKKKFDEIFEATKYTRALDSIKLIKKEAAADLKVDKERYAALATDKTRAEKLQTSIDNLKVNIEKKQIEYEELDARIVDLATRNKNFYESALGHKETLNKHETLSRQKENRQTMVSELLENIEEIENATDAELRTSREESKAKLATHTERLQSTRNRLVEVEAELQKLRRRHQHKLTELGQLKAQAQRHLNAVEERQETMVRLRDRHQIQGFEDPIGEDVVEEFFSTLNDGQKRCASELEQTKREGKIIEDDKQGQIFSLKSEDTSYRQKKQAFQEQIHDIRRRIRKFTTQIESVKTTEVDIKYQTDSIQEKQDRLTSLKESVNDTQGENNIKGKNDLIKELEDKRETLHGELGQLHRQFDTRAKLSLKRTEIKKRADGIQTIIETHGDRFKKLVEAEMFAESAEKDIERAVQKTERALATAEGSNANASRELQVIETKLQINKDKLNAAQRELATLERKIREKTGGNTLAQTLEEAEVEIAALHKDLQTITFSTTFYESVLKSAKSTNQCGTCQRAFKARDEMAAFESHCKRLIAKVPEAKAQNEENLRTWQEELKEIQDLLPADHKAKTLRDVELPELQKEATELESKFIAATRKAEEVRTEVDHLKDHTSELSLLKRSAIDMSRMTGELEDLDREIQELECELENSGSNKTTEDLEAELEVLARQLAEARKEVNTAINAREEKRASIQKLESQIYQAEMDLNVKKQQIKERDALQTRKDDSKAEIIEIENKIKEIEEKLKSSAEPLRRLEKELQEIRAQNLNNESEVAKGVQIFNASLHELECITREITKFIRSGTDQNINRCTQEINNLDKSIKQTSQNIVELQQALTDLDQESTKAKEFERNINDNIRLRAHRKEIEALDQALGDLDVEGAEKASRKFDAEYHKSRKYQAELQAEHAKLGGEIGMDKKNLKDKKAEMESEFKDIFNRHRRQLIKVKTVEIANQDLDKYAKALDQAIMKYHSHKMAEINDTIQSLWQKTYQGTDIDKILIKSENENAKSNRSYNYRVVMLKDQVEMDMRGRCSAGQKVLASIIIRLALAESFGTNCGILALDEPTTNLDKENINALACALSEIIKERRDQANFQLVVITHDEDFLNQLSQSDVLDKYWRVSRNLQQKSIIERQRMG